MPGGLIRQGTSSKTYNKGQCFHHNRVINMFKDIGMLAVLWTQVLKGAPDTKNLHSLYISSNNNIKINQ